ncbi:MAG: ABC transporter ATP-binding protein/permease [Crocinitomicaceae bacterium]|nr:ABC transporter ATP-binding protein/permease [Crocinitomicaceae bacterium]
MKSLSYLNKYFIKYKWRFLFGILFIIGSNWFKVAMPDYFGDSVDELKNWDTARPSDEVMLAALKAGGTIMLLILTSGFFLFLTRQMIIIMSRNIEYDLKNEIYNKYQELSYSFYKKNNTGDLMNRISEDVTKVRMYLGPGIMYTINLVALSTLVINNMIQINGYLTIVVLVPLPLMSFVIYKVANRIGKLSGEVQKEQSRMSTLVQETFSGIRVIKAYGRNKEVNNQLADSAEEYKSRSMRLVMTNALFMPTIFILIGISTILCIYLGGSIFIDQIPGSANNITEGDIIKFIFYVNMLTWPFASVGWVSSLISRAAASQKRINEFLKEVPEIVNENKNEFNFKGEVEFKNVGYTYPNSKIVALKDISFKISKGESLGIIGRTGTGKSTILKLIMRQIEPTSGEILIDGLDIKKINLDEYRNQTGVVPQDVFLFSDSVKNNILFGSKNRRETTKSIEAAAKEAHVHHNIIAFKDKYETILGERGVNLSGGQKQRISIARALIRNPKLLILDDCLSAVDTETEDIILLNLKKRQTTSFVVSHRISSLRNCTRIINIEGGMVVEEGSHHELLENNGSYAELYHKQLAEEDE